MHVHISAPEVFFPLLVANGITGVREMFTGVPIRTIREWSMRANVPRIYAPGFIDGPMMLNNGPPPAGAFAVANAEQARYAVHALAASGVDFLKVYNSIPRDAYFAIAQEARAIGLPFAGHVPEAVSTGEASDAGQLSEEHLINVLLDCSTNADALRAARVATMTSDKISGEARLRALAFPDPAGLFDTYSPEKAAALFAKFVGERHLAHADARRARGIRPRPRRRVRARPAAAFSAQAMDRCLGSSGHALFSRSGARGLRRTAPAGGGAARAIQEAGRRYAQGGRRISGGHGRERLDPGAAGLRVA